MVDPNNPNGVVPIGSSAPAQQAAPVYGAVNTQPTNTQITKTAAPAGQVANPSYQAGSIGPGNTPYMAAPAPAPQSTQPVINLTTDTKTNQALLGTTPTTQPTAQTTQTPQTTTQPQQAPLTLPQNGSVVDLLNAAGQDSSFAARQQLAQQFGIQGYTGTAQQNTDLAKKYTDAFNANKGTAAPQTGAQASSALDSYFTQNTQTPQVDPQKNFFDQYMSMNPVVKNLYDTINQTLSSLGTQQTFAQEYQSLVAQQGIPALQTDLLNINNVMDGTEDDIRQEITAAGGSATDSQVLALTGARNKTLLKQANVLSQQLQTKQDYVNQIMQFSQADRAEVDKQVDQKLGLTTQLADLQDKMTNAAKDNYEQIVANVGYSGLAASLKNDPQQRAQVEQVLGLGKGALSDPGFLGQQDAGKILGSASTGYFTYNPYTGETTPLAGGNGGTAGAIAPSGGTPVQSAAIPTLNGKPLNDTQATTLGYVQRMNDANTLIDKFGSSGTSSYQSLASSIPFVGNYLTSSDYQQLQQAERNFINADLRRESGAAISPSEFDSAAKQYFPQPGDSQAVIEQKTANRDRVIQSLSQNANVPSSYVTGSTPTSSGGSYQDYLKAIGQ